ncbi:hypothetical protein KCP73_21035 [Salmonella enterica subsp. enterica]|nr:hypothetical protein KCP73_21035 [Salmonella enterica subsp. enterica]
MKRAACKAYGIHGNSRSSVGWMKAFTPPSGRRNEHRPSQNIRPMMAALLVVPEEIQKCDGVEYFSAPFLRVGRKSYANVFFFC